MSHSEPLGRVPERPATVKPQTKRESGHLVLDEDAFQQLLSAAHVMQEHNARLKKQAASQEIAKAHPVASPPASVPIAQAPPAITENPVKSSVTSYCHECGSALAVGATYCGTCGTATDSAGPKSTLQKNWASLWEMHHAAEPITDRIAGNSANGRSAIVQQTAQESTAQDEEIDLFPAELEEIVAQYGEPAEEEHATKEGSVFAPRSESELDESEETALVAAGHQSIAEPEEDHSQLVQVSPWVSAVKARAWLDSLKAQQAGRDWLTRLWQLHRGNVAIALSTIVLLVVIAQWFVRPNPPATSGSPQAVAQPRELSPFEELLVSLGLAEVPPAPQVYHGNPNTRVWVDVHTALYYCPGAELYGKTQDGKFTSQADAQRDQFEPATRKACD